MDGALVGAYRGPSRLKQCALSRGCAEIGCLAGGDGGSGNLAHDNFLVAPAHVHLADVAQEN